MESETKHKLCLGNNYNIYKWESILIIIYHDDTYLILKQLG